MKDKLEILDKKMPISDQEIVSTMDFDGVLDRYKSEKLSKSITESLTNRLLTIVAVVAVLGIGAWWIYPSFKQLDGEDSVKQETLSLNDDNEKLQNADNNASEKDKSETKVAESNEPIVEFEQSNKMVDEILQKKEEVKEEDEITENALEPKHDVEKKQSPIYNYVDAEPVNGVDALYDYLNTNLKYPEEAIQDSVEGSVVVRFTITSEGLVDDINLIKSLGELFDQEAIRLIKSMPEWKPAMINDKPVASQAEIPVYFEIQN